MTPTWSRQQDQLLVKCKHWIDHEKDNPHFILHGDAGTGKTTISKELVGHCEETLGKTVAVLAYTGKAASVLRGKGLINANTLHSKMYIPAMTSRNRLNEALAQLEKIGKELTTAGITDAERRELLDLSIGLKNKVHAEEQAQKNPQFILNAESDLLDVDIIVVDEISMLDGVIGGHLEDLCRQGGARLLLMGDPNQLPPVRGVGHFMARPPDFHLTEIHRQAKDNPILYLAARARAGERLELGDYGESRVVSRFDPDEAVACDQALCGTNDTRIYYNKKMREMKGYDKLVEPGEKLMCLRNHKSGFFNGQIWYVKDVEGVDEEDDTTYANLISDDPLEPDRAAFLHNRSLRGEEVPWMEAGSAQSMTSAQMCTVHKFQGSQADHVVLMDESFVARGNRNKWLYTGITRAAKKVTIRV